jgi:hypothetical protein
MIHSPLLFTITMAEDKVVWISTHLTTDNPQKIMILGGALVKWPKYFFPPIPTKIGDSIGTSLLVNIPNFQAKK